jgi:hypothetical protein
MSSYNGPFDKGPEATLNRFLDALEQLENSQITIIENQRWVSCIGKGLANTYGDDGREYFHRLLKIGGHYRYNADVANSMYNRFRKQKNKKNMGSVFYFINPLLR